MSVDVGLMLAKPLPEIVGRANVVMAWDSHGLQNVERSAWYLGSASGPLARSYGATLSPFWYFALHVLESGVLPRCSPRGTSGRKGAENVNTEQGR